MISQKSLKKYRKKRSFELIGIDRIFYNGTMRIQQGDWKMISFNKYRKEQLTDPQFKKDYEEERELLELAFQLNEERTKQGKTQSEVAKEAHLTQQQFSRVENGDNCNILTYLKACHAIGLTLEIRPIRDKKSVVKSLK